VAWHQGRPLLETIVSRLENALARLVGWQYGWLEPLLPPAARAKFGAEAVRSIYQLRSRLGQLESIGKADYLGDKSESARTPGDFELIASPMPLQFDTGADLIKLNLARDARRYYIHHYGIQSRLFADGDQPI